MNSPIARLLDALRAHGKQPKRAGDGWTCTCPAHDDTHPSLSINVGDDGRVLLHCFAGCPTEMIVKTVGLTLKDLMSGDDKKGLLRRAVRTPPNGKPKNIYLTARDGVAALEAVRGRRSGLWTYQDAAGEPVGIVIRWDVPPKEPGVAATKDILPLSKTDKGWLVAGLPSPKPLYHLPDLLKLAPGSTVVIVEGEKCCDLARSLGFNATTSPHGAESAAKADWSPVSGLHVVILGDNDAAGKSYADTVARLARAAGAVSVKVVTLPGLPPAGDIVDFLAMRGGDAEAVKGEIEALIAGAPEASVGSVTTASEGAPEIWPDPQPLPDALPPVMSFNAELFPDALRPWLVDVADRMRCPLDYLAVAAVVGLAAIVGRKVGIRPKRHDTWLVVPNLWGVVVGRPGVMKTPALQEALKPLRRLDQLAKVEYDKKLREAAAAAMVAKQKHKQAEKDIKDLLDSEKADDDQALRIAQDALDGMKEEAVVRKRYIVNDSTVEKLGEILNQNPRGVLVHRDELVGLLKSLDKEGQEGARTFYLEAWNGTGSYTFDRIGRGTLEIPAAILSMIGGVQPGPLAQYLRAAAREGKGDDGLVQRLQLAVWPDVAQDWANVDRPPEPVARDKAYAVYAGLDHLDPTLLGADIDPNEPDGIPYLHFDDKAQELFDAWRAPLELQVRSGELHPALESHVSKFRSLIPSLALLFHLAEGNRGPVEVDALRKAVAWGAYLKSHAGRIYSHIAGGDVFAARELAKKIVAGEVKDGFSARAIYRRGWTGLSTTEEAKEAAEYLVDLDWLVEVKNPTGGRTGTVYLINPKVHDLDGPENDPPAPGPPDRTDGSGGGADAKTPDMASGPGARTDRSPSTGPSGGSVSTAQGGSPGIQRDRDEEPPTAETGGEATWSR